MQLIYPAIILRKSKKSTGRRLNQYNDDEQVQEAKVESHGSYFQFCFRHLSLRRILEHEGAASGKRDEDIVSVGRTSFVRRGC